MIVKYSKRVVRYYPGGIMKPYYETVSFENPFAPIKAYAFEPAHVHGGAALFWDLTQLNFEKSINPVCSGHFIHCHSYLEMLFIADDEVRVLMNGTTFYANKGDLVLINKYDIHEVDVSKKIWVLLIEPSKIHHIPFEKTQNLFPYRDAFKWIQKKGTETVGVQEIRAALEGVVQSLKDTEGRGNAMTTGCFYLLIDGIMKYTDSLGETSHETVHLKDQGPIHDILQYLENHYAEPISLEAIAKQAGFGRNYFCRFFKKATGRSLVRYLNEMRCQRAKDLIETTDAPITEIALDVGFSSVSYFSRKFREHWGFSPRMLR